MALKKKGNVGAHEHEAVVERVPPTKNHNAPQLKSDILVSSTLRVKRLPSLPVVAIYLGYPRTNGACSPGFGGTLFFASSRAADDAMGGGIVVSHSSFFTLA